VNLTPFLPLPQPDPIPDLEKVAARPGWDTIPAVRHGELHEIKSPIILQPGPAALFNGLDAIHRIIRTGR
jgi:ABC-type Fe3+-hydroxamate transport system substrate-binding protein